MKIVTYKPETVQVATTSQIAGLLMLGDEQFPGWEASVDGQPAPILTADEALRAVYVPAGSHTVTFIMRGSRQTVASIGRSCRNNFSKL